MSAPSRVPFEELFKLHFSELRDFAFRYVRTEADAEEIVQDAFLAVWVKRHSIAPRSTMRAYLFGAVRNRALHHSRHSAVARRFEESERSGDRDSVFPDAAHEMENAEDAVALAASIAKLPGRTRLAIELRWLRQMSYAEIAEAMDISQKGVEKHLANGMKFLRSELDRENTR